ncbi:MAG: phosphoserine phosphatase SerB, partial [Alphaproteobacteria bacterium]|nr:phosphoserine phosphatase SerB [Alphaproteobacteria bacterium]
GRAQRRRKRLLVADMDSTMIDGETLDELAAAAGVGERVAAITARAMNGELDFEAAVRERVGLLAGLPLTAADGVLARLSAMPGAHAAVATMHASGAHCMLVSGGFTLFADPVAAALGFGGVQAALLEVRDGRLTGRVREPVLGPDAKRRALEDRRRALGLTPDDTLAVGDGANDLAMLSAAGLGVAFRAKPAAAAQARVRVDRAGLTALLYLQGYSQAEFVPRDQRSLTGGSGSTQG